MNGSGRQQERAELYVTQNKFIMALKQLVLLISLVALIAAETTVLHATAEAVLPSEPEMNSAAPAISDKKIWIAPRGTLFNPPRLPPNRAKPKRSAAAP